MLKDDLGFDPKTVIFKDAKVLIVDDNAENRSLIRDLLGYSSLTILEASNGKEAVSMTKIHKPDLILMDIVMPEMNGFDATVQIKKSKTSRSIPVIAISASAKSFTLDADQRKIFSSVLLKPVNLTELVDSLKHYLKYDIATPEEKISDSEKLNIELTDEQIAQLPEIINILETEYLNEFKEVMQNQLINQMESFGKNLLSLGEQYSLQILIQFGREICVYTDNFDISKLPATLKKFPGIIDTLKNLHKSRI